MLKLSTTVYSLTRERYLAGCELHIQTLTVLVVLTLYQYVNAKTIWVSEVRNINSHNDYCHSLTTYVALKRVIFEPSLHFNTGLQSSVCTLTLVCSVQSAFYTDRFLNNLFQTGENGAFCLMTSTQIMNTFVISLVCNHFITSALAVLVSFSTEYWCSVSYFSILSSVFET